MLGKQVWDVHGRLKKLHSKELNNLFSSSDSFGKLGQAGWDLYGMLYAYSRNDTNVHTNL